MNDVFFQMKYDELNVVAFDIANAKTPKEARGLFEDTLFDAYVYGFLDLFDDGNGEIDYPKMLDTIEHEYDGVSIFDTMQGYVENGAIDDIRRLLDSEWHRVFNQAQYDAATDLGYTRKTWVTMDDDKVRDTHDYLEGVTIDIDAEFITFDGDMARFPGDFFLAQNNANCRCIVVYSE